MSKAYDHVRAEALFVSYLQRSEQPTTTAVRRAVITSIRSYGPRGCAELVASEFGEHPDTAVPRMVWALEMVRSCYPMRIPATTSARVAAR
jgi:hypothetical protein